MRSMARLNLGFLVLKFLVYKRNLGRMDMDRGGDLATSDVHCPVHIAVRQPTVIQDGWLAPDRVRMLNKS